MDFTFSQYKMLLSCLKSCGYEFITYYDYCKRNISKPYVILRHDVDQRPFNSLKIAEIEAQEGVKSTYYFRTVPESWDAGIIKAIAKMGHEVGYHYESLAICNGDLQNAFNDFCKNLDKLRKIVPVSTICMHGSPRSPHDSRDIWKHYDFKDLGIIGEPYLTTDFSQLLYLTDTGRRWDGYKVSVRDKVDKYQKLWNDKGWSFHSTDDIMMALQENRLPDHIMITTHPQRWNDFGISWIKEFVMQNIKNVIKIPLKRIWF